MNNQHGGHTKQNLYSTWYTISRPVALCLTIGCAHGYRWAGRKRRQGRHTTLLFTRHSIEDVPLTDLKYPPYEPLTYTYPMPYLLRRYI